MSRPPLLVPVFAVAALLAVVPAAPAPAAGPEAGTIVSVELELKADHGLRAQLDTDDEGVATLELERKGRLVTYEVAGKVTPAGLRVRFGRLGLIDVAFTPTRTLSSTAPPGECVGEPRTLREGVFTGTIDFTGERDYVRIEGPAAEGSMSVISQWQCPEAPTLLAGASRRLAPSPRKAGRSASLHAFSRRCYCAFDACIRSRGGRGRSVFFGAMAEAREGMKIVRFTSASAGASAFVFDHAAGTATVRPPRPFRGQATFERRLHGRNLWRSTIRIPFLGAASVNPRGPDFRVELYPEYHFD